jgi:hypothetical protein
MTFDSYTQMDQMNLLSDINLAGYTFEFAAKILLRRFRRNNFIFQINQFRDMAEIVSKYNLDIRTHQWLCERKIRADLIEFIFDDLKTRLVKEIKLYDVKVSRRYPIYPDLAKASYDFYIDVLERKLATVEYWLLWNICSLGHVPIGNLSGN